MGSAHSTLFPSPAACFLLLPPFFSARPTSRPRQSSQRPRAVLFAVAADSVDPRPVSLPSGARRSGSSPTSSPSRTRAERNHHARSHASYPSSTRLLPSKYSPRCPQLPTSTRAPAVASMLTKIAAEIQAATNPPPQRGPTPVGSLPGFVSVVRSRRDLSSVLYCSVLVANPCRTSFQGDRPPLAVVSSQRTSSAPILASGELASSS